MAFCVSNSMSISSIHILVFVLLLLLFLSLSRFVFVCVFQFLYACEMVWNEWWFSPLYNRSTTAAGSSQPHCTASARWKFELTKSQTSIFYSFHMDIVLSLYSTYEWMSIYRYVKHTHTFIHLNPHSFAILWTYGLSISIIRFRDIIDHPSDKFA